MSDRISLRDLTTQLEKGDGSSVTSVFSGKFEQERFADLDAIRKLNQADLKDGMTDITLQIKYALFGKDNISIRATNGAYDEFMGGKVVYQDDLSMRSLKHTDPKDLVPPVRQVIDISRLAQAAEKGDGKAIETALSGMYQEERAQTLTDVEKQNAADLAAHRTDASLQISLAGSKWSANTMSVTRILPGMHDYWNGGVQIYSEALNVATGNRDILARVDDRK